MFMATAGLVASSIVDSCRSDTGCVCFIYSASTKQAAIMRIFLCRDFGSSLRKLVFLPPAQGPKLRCADCRRGLSGASHLPLGRPSLFGTGTLPLRISKCVVARLNQRNSTPFSALRLGGKGREKLHSLRALSKARLCLSKVGLVPRPFLSPHAEQERRDRCHWEKRGKQKSQPPSLLRVCSFTQSGLTFLSSGEDAKRTTILCPQARLQQQQ